jgi:hypothetical protein
MERKSGFPWWLIFIFTCFLSWLSVFIAGIIVENRKWIIAGLLYSIPLFLIYTVSDSEQMLNEKQRIVHRLDNKQALSPADSAKYLHVIDYYEDIRSVKDSLEALKAKYPSTNETQKEEYRDAERKLRQSVMTGIEEANPEYDNSVWESIVMGLWIISALAAFAHALAIRKKYWELYYMKKYNYQPVPKSNSAAKQANPFLSEIEAIKKRIEDKIAQSDFLNSLIVSDIRALITRFTDQIKELINDKQRLANSLEIGQISQLKNEIEVLFKKMGKEENPRLSREYKETIKAKEKLLESYENLSIHKKTVDLRLDKALSSLKQIEYDIDRLNKAQDGDRQADFFKAFKKKAEDLSVYADELHREMNDRNL